ncbi:hypothetical protein CHLRE_01g021300v5 [Chlamydomonas reinhardtii]|uniref:Bifunctional inhibitor/plant lipid transfer protein/seed storage helical domain-containing protein n=1 Tax=Chlamydomonas reinhardtii TaxID=3055 RepID=A0A2K3E638_CHLRE|nr:uncharacterized protein CHLRE_01g021300v5 [Chlamydomonas reinhardtii]PNW88252.1 hypothetical protein CHLRE_01g021300v5 [Chlamydomonas reinhardtii]
MASNSPHSRRCRRQQQQQPLPAMLLLAAALLAAAAPSALLAAAQSLPDKGTCVATAASQQDNLNVLAPCVGGPTASCCSTVNGFAGPGAPLAYCLCYPDLLEQLLQTVESNSLAQRFGVNRNLVSSVLNSCNIPNANNAGSCPATPGGGGPGVSVTAPGTTVGVAPGGATSVTAPGTTVNAGPGGTSVTAPFTNVNVGGPGKPGPAAAPAGGARPGPAPPQPASSGGRPPFGSRIVKALERYCDTHPWHPACSK